MSLYAAFPVDAATRERLHDEWLKLKSLHPELEAAVPRPPATYHMTFVYLGDVEDASARESIRELIRSEISANKLPSRTFEFLRFELFVTTKQTYVVATARALPETSWSEYMRYLRSKLRLHAPMTGDRQWAPHVSVATLNEIDAVKNNTLYGYLTRIQWTLADLLLYEKHPDGVQRHVLAQFPLP